MSVKKDVKMPVQGSLCSVALFAVVLLCACTILTTIMTTLNNRSYVSINGWKTCLSSVSGFSTSFILSLHPL